MVPLLPLMMLCVNMLARTAQAVLGQWEKLALDEAHLKGGRMREEIWVFDDLNWIADCTVLYLVWSTSELLVLWDNTVPYCVSQHDLGFCHLQPEAFWVVYQQFHIRWIWFYYDRFAFIRALPSPVFWLHKVRADSDKPVLVSVFSTGLCLRPEVFTESSKELVYFLISCLTHGIN